MVKAALKNGRQYRIQYQDYYPWKVGQSRNSEQFLIGVYGPSIVAISFDPSGDYQHYDCQTISNEDPANEDASGRSELQRRLKSRLADWTEQKGFVPCEIKINKFTVPNFKIGIADLPSHLEKFLENPTAVEDLSEREIWFGDVRTWHLEHNFVLWWGNEYWINACGEVTDT